MDILIILINIGFPKDLANIIYQYAQSLYYKNYNQFIYVYTTIEIKDNIFHKMDIKTKIGNDIENLIIEVPNLCINKYYILPDEIKINPIFTRIYGIEIVNNNEDTNIFFAYLRKSELQFLIHMLQNIDIYYPNSLIKQLKKIIMNGNYSMNDVELTARSILKDNRFNSIVMDANKTKFTEWTDDVDIIKQYNLSMSIYRTDVYINCTYNGQFTRQNPIPRVNERYIPPAFLSFLSDTKIDNDIIINETILNNIPDKTFRFEFRNYFHPMIHDTREGLLYLCWNSTYC